MNSIQALPLENGLKAEMESKCSIAEIGKGEIIIEEGNCMKVIPLLLNGSIRVYKYDSDIDREILIYYIDPGQTCMMSLVACFGNSISKVNTVTERKSKLLMIPAAQVRSWQKKFDSWNSFVIHTFLERYSELLKAMEELSFHKIDDRIHNYLKAYAWAGPNPSPFEGGRSGRMVLRADQGDGLDDTLSTIVDLKQTLFQLDGY